MSIIRNKESLTIAIDPNIREKVDQIVKENKKYRSRSHYIELAIDNQLLNQEP